MSFRKSLTLVLVFYLHKILNIKWHWGERINCLSRTSRNETTYFLCCAQTRLPKSHQFTMKTTKSFGKNFILIQDIAPILYIDMHKNGYTEIMYLLVLYIWIYKVEFEECAYIFECISAVNNDSCKIKAKCLHSFLLIL